MNRKDLAPVAVEYDGGGVYLGGGSSIWTVAEPFTPASDVASPLSGGLRVSITGRYSIWIRCLMTEWANGVSVKHISVAVPPVPVVYAVRGGGVHCYDIPCLVPDITIVCVYFCIMYFILTY